MAGRLWEASSCSPIKNMDSAQCPAVEGGALGRERPRHKVASGQAQVKEDAWPRGVHPHAFQAVRFGWHRSGSLPLAAVRPRGSELHGGGCDLSTARRKWLICLATTCGLPHSGCLHSSDWGCRKNAVRKDKPRLARHTGQSGLKVDSGVALQLMHAAVGGIRHPHIRSIKGDLRWGASDGKSPQRRPIAGPQLDN
jgi:hypothetical protein